MKTAILSTLALLAIAGPALAAPPASVSIPRVSVAYGDLDLNTAKDAAIMLTRIQRAAGEACRETPGSAGNDAASVMRMNDCYRRSLARAVAGLDAPKVTQAFAPGARHEQLARLP